MLSADNYNYYGTRLWAQASSITGFLRHSWLVQWLYFLFQQWQETITICFVDGSAGVVRRKGSRVPWVKTSAIIDRVPGARDGRDGAMFVKEYKLPFIRWISSEDLVHSMVIMVNNTVIYTWKLLRD